MGDIKSEGKEYLVVKRGWEYYDAEKGKQYHHIIIPDGTEILIKKNQDLKIRVGKNNKL